jgi:uncharacterized membrane protein
VIAFPALLIYRLVEDKTKRLWVSLLYLGYAPFYFAAIFDFHTEVFFPLFLFLTLYFLKTNAKWYYASLVLFVSVNQAGPLLLAFFLPYVYFRSRSFRMVLWPALIAVVFGTAAYATSGHFFDWRFMVPSGGAAASAVVSSLGSKLTYVMFLLAPLLFAPVLEPLALLPAMAWLAYVFLRNYFPFASILFQYNMLVAGFLFIGLIGTLKHVDSRMLKVGLIVSLLVFVASWPQSGGYVAGTELPFSNPAYQKLSSILTRIPPNATVMASDSVFPALANRMGTYFDPSFLPQWIVLEKSDNNFALQQPYVSYYLSRANYTILENDNLLFVATLNGK